MPAADAGAAGSEAVPEPTEDRFPAWARAGDSGQPEERPSGTALHAGRPNRGQGGEVYTRENGRLVMVAVNFAMNSWGLDVYLALARDAVRNQPA